MLNTFYHIIVGIAASFVIITGIMLAVWYMKWFMTIMGVA